ncbi:fungal-specific transcription factor domain-containing protein [Powellomyces hirtus]|nr:fungal-specific transcription factor domain-containing protein [Powellomyces hirtus]
MVTTLEEQTTAQAAVAFNSFRQATTGDGPSFQRRTLIACDVCNKRKVKCDGSHPCARCVKSNVECLFATQRVRQVAERFQPPPPPSAEASPATKYTGSSLPVALPDHLQPRYDLVPNPALSAKHWRAVEQRQTNMELELEAIYREAFESPSPVSNHGQGATRQCTNGFLIPPETPISLNRGGWPNAWNLLQPFVAKQDDGLRYSTSSLSESGAGRYDQLVWPPVNIYGTSTALPTPPATPSVPTPDPAVPAHLVWRDNTVASNGIEELPELFFTHISAIIPLNMFHHATIRRRIKEGTLPDHLLYAIRTVAAPFSNCPSIVTNPLMRYAAAEPFYDAARRAISKATLVDEEKSLELVQSLLLLGWFSNNYGKMSAGWMLISQAMIMALDLQLTQDPDLGSLDHRLPSWIDREVARRTWWCTFLLDQMGSSWALRRPLFSDSAQGTAGLDQVAFPCDDRLWHQLRNTENVGTVRNNAELRGPLYFRKTISYTRGEDGWKNPVTYKILMAMLFEHVTETFDILASNKPPPPPPPTPAQAAGWSETAGQGPSDVLPDSFLRHVESTTAKIMELYDTLPGWMQFSLDVERPLFPPAGSEGADWPELNDIEWLHMYFRGALIVLHRPMMVNILQAQVAAGETWLTAKNPAHEHPSYKMCLQIADETSKLVRRVIARIPHGVEYLGGSPPRRPLATRSTPLSNNTTPTSSATDPAMPGASSPEHPVPVYLTQMHPFTMCCNFQSALVHTITVHPSAGGPARSEKSKQALRTHIRAYAAVQPFCVPTEWMTAALRRMIRKTGFADEILDLAGADDHPTTTHTHTHTPSHPAGAARHTPTKLCATPPDAAHGHQTFMPSPRTTPPPPS